MSEFWFGVLVGVGLGSWFAVIVCSLRFGVPFQVTRHGRPVRLGRRG